MHNITGGPQFIREEMDIVYAIIFANFGQVFLLIILGLLLIPVLASIIKVKMTYLVPSVLVLAVCGAFGLTGNMSGPITVLVFSMIGWIFRRYNFSVPAAVIGMLLGSMAESSLVQTLQISGGDISYVFERPITLVILTLLLFSLFGKKLIKKFTKTA
ncbi:hypothetical protein A9Q76_02075 [Arcobacter sp. 31_11_sub10_T18]|nr:hypothetical protein A9Q76_02075 [Arcobacter sp. 31_11_sub10_T18]